MYLHANYFSYNFHYTCIASISAFHLSYIVVFFMSLSSQIGSQNSRLLKVLDLIMYHAYFQNLCGPNFSVLISGDGGVFIMLFQTKFWNDEYRPISFFFFQQILCNTNILKYLETIQFFRF